MFNGFGQVHLLLPIEEEARTVRYVLFIHWTGPEYEIPDAAMGGYAIVEVEIAENPLHQMDGSDHNDATSIITDTVLPYGNIPSSSILFYPWWADSTIPDSYFIKRSSHSNSLFFLITIWLSN